jgi:formylglycine-generating enzyme required for sulfatase activity/dienelactone hydrolase
LRRALQDFASELSRRRVVRVLVAYAAVVFGALQGLDVMVTRLELPGALMRWAVLLALAGLPVSAILSWVFDWTAQGVIRTVAVDEVPEAARPRPPSARQRALIWLVLLVVVAGVGWLAWRDQRDRRARARLDEVVQLTDAGKLAEAFLEALEVEKVAPAERALARLWPEVSRLIELTSTPAGALVQARPYGAADTSWRTLGVTPIAGARISILPTQLRFSMPGRLTVERAHWRYGPYKVKLDAALPAEGEVPAGMVPVPGGEMPWLPLVGLENVVPGDVPEAYLDRDEVTNGQYRRFIEAGGYRTRAHWVEPFVDGGRTLSWEEAMQRFRDRTGQPGPATWQSGDYPEGQQALPVTGVSWYEAAAYAAWAGKSLPTIYHWARAATTWASPEMVPRSNFGGQGLLPASPGGASGFGLHDMAGNAKEWCWNAAGDRRYILGGAFDEPIYMFNDADAQPPFAREHTFGFRLAQYPRPVRPALLAPLQREVRDYSKERPVDEAAFRIYAGLYGYDRGPLDARAEPSAGGDRWRVERVTFNAAYRGERLSALVFTPTSVPPPWQVVVHFPGSGALHARSSAEVGTNPFSYLMKGGRAVVYPIYKSTYERGDGLASDNQDQTRNYRDHVLMWAQDLSRTLDYVETRPDLDATKIAYHGVSWGAALGPLLAAVEPRLKAVVLVSGGLEFQKTLPEVDPLNFAPRARQPTLMLNGRYDFFFPVDTSQLPLFRLLGAPPQDKRQVIVEGGHAPPQDLLVRETSAWLDRYLGPVR